SVAQTAGLAGLGTEPVNLVAADALDADVAEPFLWVADRLRPLDKYQLIDELEAKGYVRRAADPADPDGRRAKLVMPTSRAQAGVGLVPAPDSTEHRLALAVPGCGVPAVGAVLGGVGGRHQLEPVPDLVGQPAGEHRPALLGNRPVQPCLRLDVAARLVDGAP